jgi:hypothetical protein
MTVASRLSSCTRGIRLVDVLDIKKVVSIIDDAPVPTPIREDLFRACSQHGQCDYRDKCGDQESGKRLRQKCGDGRV